MKLTIEQALQQGIAAHKEGKLQDAERLYRAILQSQPLHPDANHNLGVLAVSVNKADAALPLFKTALVVNPKIEKFWLSYIEALIREKRFENAKQVIEQAKKQGVTGDKLNVLQAQLDLINKQETGDSSSPSQEQLSKVREYYQNGQLDDAKKLALSITQKFPQHPFGWKVLGAVLNATGKKSEAVDAFQKAVGLSPQDAETHYNLGITLQELGRLDEAMASYHQAIASKPDYAEAHINLGVTLQSLGRLDEAMASYHQAIASKPDYAKAHSNLGVTLQSLGRLDEAMASYHQAIALKPDYAEAHGNLGVTLQELGRLDEAMASYHQAIASKPDYAEAHINLGVTLQRLGRLDEAMASYHQAIASKPDYAEAHRLLTSIKKFDSEDDQYLQMLELCRNEDMSEQHRCHIYFGLAKACEDLGNFEQAYAHYSRGNGLRRKLLNYDIHQDIELFEQLKSSYPEIEKNSLEPDKLSKNLKPIFIVGMPRSGTTLVEQIISSHSQVTGAGELNFVGQFGADIATGSTEANHKSLLKFRHNYLNKLQNFSDGNLIVIDKMPQNFRYIGLLAAAFPEAKIVHIKRNPSAVCWANYKQYFRSKSIGYCYAIDDVISYHKLYLNLMDFWKNTLSKKIYNLDYEQLTVYQESETRQVIEYLGLDWDKNCLSPQHNMRSVATASNIQVRRKVYQGSSIQWKKYQPFLNGAFDDLLSS